MISRSMRLMAVVGAVAGVATSVHAASYSVAVVPTAAGTTTPGAINDNGVVVGKFQPSSVNGAQYPSGFVYTPGSGVVTSPSLNNTSSTLVAVNSLGTAVGNSGVTDYDTGATTAAIVFSGGTSTQLASPGGKSTYASGINTGGKIIGYGFTADNTTEHVFLWSSSSSSPVDEGTLSGSGYSTAAAINASGQFTGMSSATGAAIGHAYISSGALSGATDLGLDSGFVGSSGSAINDSGEVVGYEINSSYGDQAFYYTTKSGILTLSLLPGATSSTANGVDAAGDIVGTSGNKAVLWSPILGADGSITYGLPLDLNTLDGTPGYTLTAAYGINTSGQILALTSTTQSAVLTVAVPEPASLGLLAIAAPMLMRRRRHA